MENKMIKKYSLKYYYYYNILLLMGKLNIILIMNTL